MKILVGYIDHDDHGFPTPSYVYEGESIDKAIDAFVGKYASFYADFIEVYVEGELDVELSFKLEELGTWKHIQKFGR